MPSPFISVIWKKKTLDLRLHRARCVTATDFKKAIRYCSQSTPYYVSLESPNTTAAKAKTTDVFFSWALACKYGCFSLLFNPILRSVEKRPWRLYSQATLVQSHKVKLVLTSEFGIIIRIGDVCTQANIKVHTLKRRGFHVFIKASIVKEMIAVNTFNIFKVCWICNCFL